MIVVEYCREDHFLENGAHHYFAHPSNFLSIRKLTQSILWECTDTLLKYMKLKQNLGIYVANFKRIQLFLTLQNVKKNSKKIHEYVYSQFAMSELDQDLS